MTGWRRTQISAGLGPVLLLASCGQPGSPIAPSLELPRAVEDLSATRKGDKVTLRWTPPNRFTDGRVIRRLGPTQICRAEGTAPAATCNVVGTVPAPPPAAKRKALPRTPGEYVDVLPANLQGSPDKG